MAHPLAEAQGGLGQLVEVRRGDGAQVGITAVQQNPPEGPPQVPARGPGGEVEFLESSAVPVEQVQIHAQPAGVHRTGERAGELPAHQQVIVQRDAADQRQVGQVGHHHTRPAVRVVATVHDRGVEQAQLQRGVEPVLQPGPPIHERGERLHARASDAVRRVLTPDPGAVLGTIRVLHRHRRQGHRPDRRVAGHRRSCKAAVYSART
jgi:hypothetical protein